MEVQAWWGVGAFDGDQGVGSEGGADVFAGGDDDGADSGPADDVAYAIVCSVLVGAVVDWVDAAGEVYEYAAGWLAVGFVLDGFAEVVQ